MTKITRNLRTILQCAVIIVVGALAGKLVDVLLSEKEPKVENIIFMIGDGMGISHISATQIAQDYQPLNLERATHIGLQKTYSANNRITDSAAAGTALATGYKTNNGMIGVTPDTVAHPSIREKAERAGMATGIIATYPATNATPAAFVAHVPHRSMEDDIATFYTSNQVDVVIAGGSKRFNQRADSLNLFESLTERGYIIANNLQAIDNVESGKVMVFPTDDSMPTILQGREESFLPEATAKALEILTANAKANKSGFFLMVEGSQIDGFGHKNDVEGVITETKDFDNAVKVAFDYADEHPETLVVVTADHATGGISVINGNRTFDLYDHQVDYAWTTRGHTGEMVPIFSYGAGAKHFTGVFENNEIAQIMFRLLGLEE